MALSWVSKSIEHWKLSSGFFSSDFVAVMLKFFWLRWERISSNLVATQEGSHWVAKRCCQTCHLQDLTLTVMLMWKRAFLISTIHILDPKAGANSAGHLLTSVPDLNLQGAILQSGGPGTCNVWLVGYLGRLFVYLDHQDRHCWLSQGSRQPQEQVESLFSHNSTTLFVHCS